MNIMLKWPEGDVSNVSGCYIILTSFFCLICFLRVIFWSFVFIPLLKRLTVNRLQVIFILNWFTQHVKSRLKPTHALLLTENQSISGSVLKTSELSRSIHRGDKFCLCFYYYRLAIYFSIHTRLVVASPLPLAPSVPLKSRSSFKNGSWDAVSSIRLRHVSMPSWF